MTTIKAGFETKKAIDNLLRDGIIQNQQIIASCDFTVVLGLKDK